MFTLGAADFYAPVGDPGIVKSESGPAFLACDYDLRLLDDDSLWRKSTELSETTLVL